jgi:hypothetical protein
LSIAYLSSDFPNNIIDLQIELQMDFEGQTECLDAGTPIINNGLLNHLGDTIHAFIIHVESNIVEVKQQKNLD